MLPAPCGDHPCRRRHLSRGGGGIGGSAPLWTLPQRSVSIVPMEQSPEKTLDQVLDEIEAEITRLKTLESGSSDKLAALSAKLTELRAAPESTGKAESVGGLFGETFRSFEASHPHAAEAIERIMLLLSSIGI